MNRVITKNKLNLVQVYHVTDKTNVDKIMAEGLIPTKKYPRPGTLGVVDLLLDYVAFCRSIQRSRREIFAFPDIRKVEKEFAEMEQLFGPTVVIAIDIEPEKAVVAHQSPIQIFIEKYEETFERLIKEYLENGGRKATVTKFQNLDPKKILLKLAYPKASRFLPEDSAKRLFSTLMVLGMTYWETLIPLGEYNSETAKEMNRKAVALQNVFTVNPDCLDHEVLLGTETISPSRLKLVNL